jgi:hypothetical protein
MELKSGWEPSGEYVINRFCEIILTGITVCTILISSF